MRDWLRVSFSLLATLIGCGGPDNVDSDGKVSPKEMVGSQSESSDLCELTKQMAEICEPDEGYGDEEMDDCENEADALTELCYQLAVDLMQCQIDFEACGLEVFDFCSREFEMVSTQCFEA